MIKAKSLSQNKSLSDSLNTYTEKYAAEIKETNVSLKRPSKHSNKHNRFTSALKSELSEEKVKILEVALKVYGYVSDHSKLEWLSRITGADMQSIISWFETHNSRKHQSPLEDKIKKTKKRAKGVTKKVYVNPETKQSSPKKPVKKRSKKTKILDTVIQPQTISEGKIHIQKSQCQNPIYSRFEKCRSCIRKNGDVCRFREFRVFQENPVGELIYGPAFRSCTTNQPSTSNNRNRNVGETSITEEMLALGGSSSFPPEVEASHENYLRKTIAPSLLAIVDREIEFMHNRVYYQRAASIGVRQMCDVCLTSIFNGFWLCCVCGMEICMYCYNEWTTRNPKVGLCSYKRNHEKSQMIRISRISLQELEHLRNQLLSSLTSTDITHNSDMSSGFIEGKQMCEAGYLCAPYECVSLEEFQEKWRKGETVVIQNILPNLQADWSPNYFMKQHANEGADMVDCSSGCTVTNMTVGDFFRGFTNSDLKPRDHEGKPLIMRIKDWPSDMDFNDKFPKHFVDFMESLPFPEYTQRRGILNLASRLPSSIVPPDLGPKMYNAYGSSDGENGVGTTPLHLDMADAVNLMVYSVDPEEAIQKSNDGYVDIGAVWDIYRFEDLPKIRQFLREYAAEIGHSIDDPIHDQIFYLNKPLRQRLFDEYGVQGWRIYQNPGDVVFVPAGCAHQVCNYKNCIKVAMDFVSPENVSKCAELTREFRLLSQGHRRRQDLLQLENILYYSWLNSEDAFKGGQ